MSAHIKTILYTSDLDHNMRSALRMAASLATQYQAKLILLHVIEPLDNAVYNWGDPSMWQKVKDKAQQRAKELSEEIVNDLTTELAASGLSLPKPEITILNGNPARSIVDYSKQIGADMIVMGTRHQNTLGQILLGSVAEKVMRTSECIITMVPQSR